MDERENSCNIYAQFINIINIFCVNKTNLFIWSVESHWNIHWSSDHGVDLIKEWFPESLIFDKKSTTCR